MWDVSANKDLIFVYWNILEVIKSVFNTNWKYLKFLIYNNWNYKTNSLLQMSALWASAINIFAHTRVNYTYSHMVLFYLNNIILSSEILLYCSKNQVVESKRATIATYQILQRVRITIYTSFDAQFLKIIRTDNCFRWNIKVKIELISPTKI